jgi:hypothetical protein
MKSRIFNYFIGAALFVCPFFSLANAEDKLVINYNIQGDYSNIKNIVDKTFSQVLERDGKKISSINLNINIGLDYTTGSYTDAQNKNCNININYKDKTPLLLSNFNNDFQFTLWHEIGHCILGKEIFHEKSFSWSVPIENKHALDDRINYQTKLSIATLECNDCEKKVFKIAPPIAVYHETYADIYALIWWIASGKELREILMLSKKRIDEFNSTPISNFYASGFAIPILLEQSGSNKLNLDLVEKVSQKGFVEYLNFINDNYLKTLHK